MKDGLLIGIALLVSVVVAHFFESTEGNALAQAPGVAHWHGSGPYSYALKIVLGFGAPTEWPGEPVSEEEYAQARNFFDAEP